MVMAMITVSWVNGINSETPTPGYELNLALGVLALVVGLLGAGRVSLDAIIASRLRKPSDPVAVASARAANAIAEKRLAGRGDSEAHRLLVGLRHVSWLACVEAEVVVLAPKPVVEPGELGELLRLGRCLRQALGAVVRPDDAGIALRVADEAGRVLTALDSGEIVGEPVS